MRSIGYCSRLVWVCLVAGCIQATPELTVTPEVETVLTDLVDAAVVTEFDVPIASPNPQKAETSGDHSPLRQSHNEPWTARIMALMGGLGMLYLIKYRVKPVRLAFDWVQGKKNCDGNPQTQGPHQ
jgi:hypothetical protein